MELRFRWQFRLGVAPARLWRYIADTGSLNQAAGLPEWKLRYIPESDGGSHQVGETRYLGWRLRWEEHPFEWVEGREYQVLRVYDNGPIRTFHMAVRLQPIPSGTLLEEIITVEPRWLLMVPGIYWEIGYRSRKRFERVYRKIEQFLERQTETPFPPQIRHALSRDRVEKLRSRLRETEGAEWLPQLLDVLETSPTRNSTACALLHSPTRGVRIVPKS